MVLAVDMISPKRPPWFCCDCSKPYSENERKLRPAPPRLHDDPRIQRGEGEINGVNPVFLGLKSCISTGDEGKDSKALQKSRIFLSIVLPTYSGFEVEQLLSVYDLPNHFREKRKLPTVLRRIPGVYWHDARTIWARIIFWQ
jgi:hypothetical protein